MYHAAETEAIRFSKLVLAGSRGLDLQSAGTRRRCVQAGHYWVVALNQIERTITKSSAAFVRTAATSSAASVNTGDHIRGD
jgi:hypothetical protein